MSMPSRPLLEGHVEPDDSEGWREEIRRLNRQVVRLNEELEELRDAKEQARKAQRVLAQLRRQLEPQYRSMQALFGELDSAGIEASDATASISTRVAGVWDSWKSKLGGKQAEFIQAMLEHGHPMTSEQLRVATHTGRSTVPQIIYKLNTLGLINKNNGKISLKEL
jgi:DNA-binding transcriptional regulator GbsR (MarR family)